MNITGIAIAVSTFLVIGLFHPIVIKTEYYFGTRPWWVFGFVGVACIVCSLCIESTIWSSIIGVVGASSLWAIGEPVRAKTSCGKGLVSHESKTQESISW